MLERHRDELARIPGVIGVGIGFAQDDPGKAVIQLFVGFHSAMAEAQRKATPIVGKECPLEVVFMPTPDAEEGQQGEVIDGQEG